MKKFENFYQSDRLVWNWLSWFNGFQLKFIIGVVSNSEHPSLFWSYLSHLNSELHSVFFFFFWIPYSSRNIMSNFQNFS